MNLWEDEAAKAAIVATGRETLVFAGLLTEACVSFPVLSAQENQSINGVMGTTPVVGHFVFQKIDVHFNGLSANSIGSSLDTFSQRGQRYLSAESTCSSKSSIGFTQYTKNKLSS
jgi:hypothetical protein